jgi:hypothetical protein
VVGSRADEGFAWPFDLREYLARKDTAMLTADSSGGAARLFAHLSIYRREHPEQAQTEPWPIEKILETIACPSRQPGE